MSRALAKMDAGLMPSNAPAVRQASHGPRRGLNCPEAAAYIGVSVTKFLEMVEDGRMPKAKTVDRRRVWDIRQLDLAFDALPGGDDEDAPSPRKGEIVL